jgi:hypothetical protein
VPYNAFYGGFVVNALLPVFVAGIALLAGAVLAALKRDNGDLRTRVGIAGGYLWLMLSFAATRELFSVLNCTGHGDSVGDRYVLTALWEQCDLHAGTAYSATFSFGILLGLIFIAGTYAATVLPLRGCASKRWGRRTRLRDPGHLEDRLLLSGGQEGEHDAGEQDLSGGRGDRNLSGDQLTPMASLSSAPDEAPEAPALAEPLIEPAFEAPALAAPTPAATWSGYVLAPYTSASRWWEAVHATRRLAIALLQALAPYRSPVLPVGVTLVLTLSLLAHAWRRPFRAVQDNRWEAASLWLLLTTYIASFVLSTSDTAATGSTALGITWLLIVANFGFVAGLLATLWRVLPARRRVTGKKIAGGIAMLREGGRG